MPNLIAPTLPDPKKSQTPLATANWEPSKRLSVSWTQKGVLYLANENPASFDTLGTTASHHALIVGGTRAGKGTSFLIPNLLLHEGSAFVVDPKGENAVITARRRGKGSKYCTGMGQKVFLLDPFGVASRPDDDFADIRARYNPLDAIDVNAPNAVDLVNALCSAIVNVPEQGDNAIWKEAARRLLKATILHVLTSPDFDDDQRTLVTVYKRLNFGDQEKQEFLRDIEADEIPTAHALLYKSMSENRALGGMIAVEGETFANMSADTPKQYMGVIETLKSDLEFMDSASMQETLSASDFSFKDFKDNPKGISVYLSLPLSMLHTHFRWLRMMVTLSLNTFEVQKYQPKSGQSIMMMLDEFASLKHMPQMENGIAQMAGYGVKFVLAVQCLPQLKLIYKDNWETFVANCGTKIFLSNEDHFTRDYVSKLVGETEITRFTTSQTDGGGTGSTHSTTDTTSSGTSNGTSSNNGLSLFSFNWGQNDGSSRGTSHSIGETTSINKTWAEAKQEAIHVRPLVRPAEVGRFFAYIDEPNGAPYAGHSLVLISGFQPFAVRKTLYYRHLRFESLFDPHPDHSFRLAYRPPIEIIEPPVLDFDEPILFKPYVPLKPWWQRMLFWVRDWAWKLLKSLFRFLTSKLGLIWFWTPMSLAALIVYILIATGLIVDVALFFIAFFY